jgi:hypothetical protein
MSLFPLNEGTERVAERMAYIREIVAHARRSGLDANFRCVNRNYLWWSRWHTGQITTGYLIKAVHVRRISDAR